MFYYTLQRLLCPDVALFAESCTSVLSKAQVNYESSAQWNEVCVDMQQKAEIKSHNFK